MQKQPQQVYHSDIMKEIKTHRTKPFNQSIITGILYFTGAFAIIAIFFIILFLIREALPFIHNVDGYTLWDLVSQRNWHPEFYRIYGQGFYGANSIIFGSILVTIGAMLFAVPFGLACAIFIAEIAPPKLRVFLKTAVELLAGIPSIVYGFFGLKVFLPFLVKLFPEREKTGFAGSSWLAASIILGIMALPTIVSVTEDALSSVPQEYLEASLAMGATKWQTISKVLVPSSISGITAAVILGMGRAIGETMAVMLVAGNSLKFPEGPWAIFERLRTITATIATEQKEAPYGSDWFHSLFVLGVILFGMTLLINLASTLILKKINERFQPPPKDEGISSLNKNIVSYSVARLPGTINGELRIKEHSFSNRQLEDIQNTFEVFGKRLIYYGIISALSYVIFFIGITAEITFNYEIIMFSAYASIIMMVTQYVTHAFFITTLKKLKNQMNEPRFDKFYVFIIFSSLFTTFSFLLLGMGLFLAETNIMTSFILIVSSCIIFAVGIIFDFLAWTKMREFFIINPIIIKRKAIESSKNLFIVSILKVVLVVFMMVFNFLILTTILDSSNTTLIAWLEQNRVISTLGVLVLTVIFVTFYIGGVFRLGRSFTPPPTEQQQRIRSWIIRIILIIGISIMALYAFNWVVLVVILPLIFGFNWIMKKINPKVTQVVSYSVVSFFALVVMLVLGILTFYIYRGGLQILGISLLYILIAAAIFLMIRSLYADQKKNFRFFLSALNIVALILLVVYLKQIGYILYCSLGAIIILFGILNKKIELSTFFTWVSVIIILFAITVPTIFKNGWTLSGEEGIAFLTQITDPLDIHAGGILNQILGTTWLVLFTMLVAIPIGIGGGIYLAEYSKPGPLLNLIRTAIDNLNGTPSIVFGLFGLSFFVHFLGFNVSLLSGIFTMALMVLPTLMRITEEAIKAVPQGLKEGSYAMGATRWQTIRKVILPVAKPSIITGVVLSMGRVAGETAPVLLVAAALQKSFTWAPFRFPFSRFFPRLEELFPSGSFLDRVQLLPYHILDMTTELQDSVRAGASALVLFVLVLVLFSIATFMRLKTKNTKKAI